MKILILGANSEIAHAAAKQFAQYERADFFLASRDMSSLEKKADDIQVRYGVDAKAVFFDATDIVSHRSFYHQLDPKPEGVILAFGYFGDQSKAQKDFSEAQQMIDVNFAGAASILEVVAEDFEKRGSGFIIAISSVAGDRGRQSNYIYGSTKAALTVFISGLRNRLDASGIRVMTILPGFVRTKMTTGMDFPGILMSTPEDIAKDVYNAYKKGKDIVYTRWFWRLIMLLIKITPEKIFKKTNI